jgi:hypothetical protein
MQQGVNNHECAAAVEQRVKNAVDQAVDLASRVLRLNLLLEGFSSQDFASKKKRGCAE